MGKKYVLRFFFDWCSMGCLWAENDAALNDFGLGLIDSELPLTAETLERAKALSIWHDQSLNWDYPPDPGPWRQEECDRFNLACQELLQAIREELGDKFEVINKQRLLAEDPDLDRYLEVPAGFKREKKTGNEQ